MPATKKEDKMKRCCETRWEDVAACCDTAVAAKSAVTCDKLALVIECVTPAPARHLANVAVQTSDDSAIESGVRVMEHV